MGITSVNGGTTIKNKEIATTKYEAAGSLLTETETAN